MRFSGMENLQAARSLLSKSGLLSADGPDEKQFENLSLTGWRKLAELRQAVSSLEAQTMRWKEVTQVNSDERTNEYLR